MNHVDEHGLSGLGADAPEHRHGRNFLFGINVDAARDPDSGKQDGDEDRQMQIAGKILHGAGDSGLAPVHGVGLQTELQELRADSLDQLIDVLTGIQLEIGPVANPAAPLEKRSPVQI